MCACNVQAILYSYNQPHTYINERIACMNMTSFYLKIYFFCALCYIMMCLPDFFIALWVKQNQHAIATTCCCRVLRNPWGHVPCIKFTTKLNNIIFSFNLDLFVRRIHFYLTTLIILQFVLMNMAFEYIYKLTGREFHDFFRWCMLPFKTSFVMCFIFFLLWLVWHFKLIFSF